MDLRRGILALVVAGVLTSQASAQIFSPFGTGFGWPGMWGGGGLGMRGFGGFPYGGYPYGGGFGGYGGFSVPTVWQSSPITAYTTATTIPYALIPPDSPVLRDPHYLSWAERNGYYLRPGQQAPRYRRTLYPATPVDASDLATPRELTGGGTDNRARLQVLVPSQGAQDTIDGARTKQTGTVRNFMTPPLEPGYEYTITVQLQDGGQLRHQVAHVRAGNHQTVDFTKDM